MANVALNVIYADFLLLGSSVFLLLLLLLLRNILDRGLCLIIEVIVIYMVILNDYLDYQ